MILINFMLESPLTTPANIEQLYHPHLIGYDSNEALRRIVCLLKSRSNALERGQIRLEVDFHYVLPIHPSSSLNPNTLHPPSATVITSGVSVDMVVHCKHLREWCGNYAYFWFLKTTFSMKRPPDVDQCPSEDAQTIRIDSTPCGQYIRIVSRYSA